MRLGQFGELAFLIALALNGGVLLFEGLGYLVLVGGVLRLVLLGQIAQRVVLVLRLAQAVDGLAHVFGVGLCSCAGFGADEQAVLGAQYAMAVGAQLEAFAARVLAAGVVFDSCDVAQAQLAVLVVALELYLNLLLGVVQDEVVAAARCAVAAAGNQFP